MDKTTDRYVHALSDSWRTEVIDRKVEQYNEQRRQMAFEANRLRIQLELDKQKLYSHNKGRKTIKSEQIRELCNKYPYNARVHYKLKNGRIVVRRIVSVWHEDEAGRPVCNAALPDNTRTVIMATRVVRRITKNHRKEDAK